MCLHIYRVLKCSEALKSFRPTLGLNDLSASKHLELKTITRLLSVELANQVRTSLFSDLGITAGYIQGMTMQG